MKRTLLFLSLLVLGACYTAPLQPRDAAGHPWIRVEDEIHVCGRDFAALNSETRRVVDVIAQLHDWERLGNDKYHPPMTPAELDRAVASVSTASIADIRSAVAILTQPNHLWPEIHGRVYVFMRALFPLETFVRLKDARCFGGWVTPHPAGTGGSFFLSWPLQKMGGRTFRIEPYLGFFGAPYDAAAEFDYFQTNWPLKR